MNTRGKYYCGYLSILYDDFGTVKERLRLRVVPIQNGKPEDLIHIRKITAKNVNEAALKYMELITGKRGAIIQSNEVSVNELTGIDSHHKILPGKS